MTLLNEISSEFPFESKYIDLLGSQLHYVEEGEGDPILFLHGVPTSSYLWRNIIPQLSDKARCIAVDLIGFGKSGKPDIEYTIQDHIQYIEAFIDKLQLKNITLVLHAWGSVIGFDIAMRHPEKFKAIAFLESHIRPPTTRDMISLPVQELAMVLSSDDAGYDVIMNSNYYVNKVLPGGVLRTLSEDEMKNYREPFDAPGSCQPIWQFLQELPLGDEQTSAVPIIEAYSQKLQESDLPKLMMYGIPGFLTTIDTVIWARDHFPNLELVDIGDALHYAQESNPEVIGSALREWYCELASAPIV